MTVRGRRIEGRVRAPAAPGGRLHARADRRALDGRDQGRLLQVAGVAPRQAADPARRDREAPLIGAPRPDGGRRTGGARYVLARIARRRSPTIASSPGSIIHTPMTSCRPEPGDTSMLGLPSRSLPDHLGRRQASRLVIPAHAQVRDRVGDRGHEDLGLDVLEGLQGLRRCVRQRPSHSFQTAAWSCFR